VRVPVNRPVVLLAVVAAVGLVGAVPVTTAHADERTVSVTNFRSGWDPAEPGLSGLAPTDSDFGVVFDTPLKGQIYAQPLVIDKSGSTPATVVVATEADKVYGLNPNTGEVRWADTLGKPWPSSTVGCGNITTQIGVTSTPVYDPSTHTVYVMAKSNGTTKSGAADPNHPHWRLHGLNIANGHERNGWPVPISGRPDNNRANTFNPKTNAQRPGLLLMGHTVYAGFASYCDVGPFDGYVAGVSTQTHRMTTLWATVTGTNDGWAGIWQSGGGLVSDGAGRILIATGNGNGNAPKRGSGTTSHPTNFSQSVVRLDVGSNGKLTAKDFFSPSNNASLNADDLDLGAGGPLAIPKKVDGRRLLVQVGKDGRVFLLDRDNLGGMGQGPHGTDAAVDIAGPFNGVWGHPAYWGGLANAPGNGGYVYDVENQGPLRAFHISTSGTGAPALTPVGTSAGDFGYTSGSPVVTSSGLGAGGAVVWVVYTKTPFGKNGELRAYDATPHDGTLDELYSSSNSISFDDEKFTTPATDGNRIYFGTAAGHLLAFGEQSTPAVAASPTYFGILPVGSSTTGTVTIKALRSTTIQISNGGTHAPFSVDAVSQHLDKDETLGVPVTFSPTNAGSADGDLAVTSTGGRTDHLDLFGYGSQDGFAAATSSLDFGEVPIGSSKTVSVDIENTGTSAQQVSTSLIQSDGTLPLSVPADPSFAIKPLQTVSIPITYAPGSNADSTDSATLGVSGTSGTSATVNIAAASIEGEATLRLLPNPLSFGSATVGTPVSKVFTLRNTGNIPLTFSKAAPPAGDFRTSTPLPEGTTLQPNQAIRQQVTFTPSKRGARNGTYFFNFSDGTGTSHAPQIETLHGSGIDPIAKYYASLGGRYSSLGRPRGPEQSVAHGLVQRYRHGRIYWSAATGAHALHGPVLRHYLSLKGPAGFAGYPISNVHRTVDRRGHVASFAHDTAIYTRKHIGTFEVNGAIRDQWNRLSNVIGRLGYPTSDEFKTHHRLRRSNFQHGHITWNPRTHRTKVKYSRH
jgi:hypothetical protein